MEKKATFKELVIAHNELLFLNQELEKRNGRLISDNEKNILKSELKTKKQVSELKIANDNLQDAETNLDEITFTISHKIRKAVANILGLAYQLIDDESLSSAEMIEMTNIIIQSAKSLNTFTEELSKSIHSQKNLSI